MLAPLLMLALMQHPTTVPEVNRGFKLYRNCQALIRYQDAGTGRGSDADATDAMFCMGYLNGFIDTMDFAHPNVICEKNATVETAVRVYVAYMQAHPKDRDVEMVVGVFESMLEAYPCPIPAK